MDSVLVSLISTLLFSFRSRLALQAEILDLPHQLNIYLNVEGAGMFERDLRGIRRRTFPGALPATGISGPCRFLVDTAQATRQDHVNGEILTASGRM